MLRIREVYFNRTGIRVIFYYQNKAVFICVIPIIDLKGDAPRINGDECMRPIL